jgi:hypothetical protein
VKQVPKIVVYWFIYTTEDMVWLYFFFMLRFSHGTVNAQGLVCMVVLMFKYGIWLVE